MTWRSTCLALAIALATASCEGARDNGGTTTAVTTGSTPATGGTSDEPPQTVPAPPPAPAIAAPPGQPGALPPRADVRVVVSPAAGVTQAEDGHGATVPAHDPVNIEVRGHVGGHALGPELEVGQLRFREHTYPSPGVVRFVCADRALLTRGVEVALVYGTQRTVVSTSLEVP
jgi:hypothetical protein